MSLVIDAPHTNLWGNELILRNGKPLGSITSAAFGHTIGKPVALGLISAPMALPIVLGSKAVDYKIDLAGERYAAAVSLKAPYDPDSRRVRS